MVGKFADELPEEGFHTWEFYFLSVGTDVTLVDPVVVVVSADRIVAVLSPVVKCIFDSLGELLGLRHAKYADPDDLVAEIPPSVPDHFDVDIVIYRRTMVITPSK